MVLRVGGLRVDVDRANDVFLVHDEGAESRARIVGAATVVGAFLTGWPSIIAVIVNYVKRSEARGTWLETHFRWQIRTFWFGLLWVTVCVLFIVATLGIGLLIAWLTLEEVPTPLQAAGAGGIIVGSVLVRAGKIERPRLGR